MLNKNRTPTGNQSRGKSKNISVVAATELVRGLGGPADLFVFLEAHAAQQRGHHPASTTGGRGRKSRADDAGHLGVSVTILGAEKHDSAVCPPQADSDDTSEDESAESEEHPMLTHLKED